jgi:gliding motility-associated-like protein
MAVAGAGSYVMLSRTSRSGIIEDSGIIPAGQAIQSEPADEPLISRKVYLSEIAELPVPATSPPVIIIGANSATRTDEPQQKSGDETTSEIITTEPGHGSGTTATPAIQAASSEKESGTEPETIAVRIDFKASPTSGCSPLAVNFQNFSENAERISWNFGDGGNSDETNPSYVFDEPGKFLVTLKVRGKDGQDYSHQRSVEVYETPEALFEFDTDLKPARNQPINFYNYSRGADYYEWDFGDNQRSVLQEPIHLYQEAGNYNVRLKVWTNHQCYDSLVIFNAFTTQEQAIKVPNAFTPNLNGPTGGYYDVNDHNNTVFHPVTSSELLEFQLKVFSRKGVLLFESNDISIGWDGYYNEQLMNQDVYIWKIRGKFNNGKTFVESGDVTLIKQS